MLLTNYFAHSFILAVLFIFYFLIAYFNYGAITTALQNKQVNVLKSPGGCDYNIDILPNNQKCTQGDFSGKYYFTLGNFTFALSTTDTNYLNVCKTICDQYDAKSPTPCQGTANQINNYNDCINELKPSAGCKGLEKPLAYRYSGINKVNFYASQIIELDECI